MGVQIHGDRRVFWLSAVTILAFAVMIARLFYVQVLEHDFYVKLADKEQIKQFTLRASRGEIYAMDGDTPVKLVMNTTVYTVWADPTLVTDKQKVIEVMNRVAGGNVRKDFGKYLDTKNSRYQVLATKVTRTQAEKIKAEKLAGIGFDAATQRVYPEGALASQVLGFVNSEGQGKYGFEQANDEVLSGKNGELKTVTDVRDVPLTVTDKNIKRPAVNGKNMVLTIDRNIQSKVEEALVAGVSRSGATRASAIVMEPQTGKVLAMANAPTYDPSNLNVKDVAVFNNNTISNPYEPGSDIKTFTVATGVDRGVITPESTYDNTGKIKVEDIVVNNATKNAAVTGTITMQTALNWSLNTGMVTIAQRLGNGTYITRSARDTIYSYFHDKLKLGELTGIELANEAKGTIVSPQQQEGNAVRYSNMVFGQGMNVTMLQVASGFCAIVNGGLYRAPTVLGGTIDDNGVFTAAAAKPQERVITKATSNTVREMVHQSHYATYNPKDG